MLNRPVASTPDYARLSVTISMSSSSLDPTDALIVSRLLYLDDTSCGYCHGKKEKSGGLQSSPEIADIPEEPTHITIGCQVQQMTCQQYDDFINRGFRRSGNFLYTGDMLRGCCRSYTIRTDMDHLKIMKEHRQVVNRFKRAIGYDKTTKGPFDLSTLITAEQSSNRFHTRFEPSGFSAEKFELYKKYQVKVHNDDPSEVSERQFRNFLCKTPFPDSEVHGTKAVWNSLNNWVSEWKGVVKKTKKRIGPTHECYYLDNKLIAISVLDFLPSGLSSIYFIWDPDFAHLSLGTLSGLREIQMCRELDLGYYYLGYYIDDCPKMKYKGKFGGQLLDLVNNAWVDLKDVRPLIENDLFFTLGEKSEPLKEPTVSHEEKGLVWSGPIKNISDALYGDRNTYESAENILKQLIQKYKLDGFELPDVLPGALPLWALQEILESNPEFEASILMMATGTWGSFLFDEMMPVMRAYVLDFVRLFGLERVKETIIIM